MESFNPITEDSLAQQSAIDAELVQRLMRGEPVDPVDLQRLGLPADYNAARQQLIQNNEASGNRSGLIGAMTGVMESPVSPLLLAGGMLGMAGAFGGATGAASGLYDGSGLAAELGAGAPNVWQSIADLGPLAGPTQGTTAPGYTLGDAWGSSGDFGAWGGADAAGAGNYAPVTDLSYGAYSPAATADSSVLRGLGQVGQGLFGGGGSGFWPNLIGQGLNAYMGYRGATNAADAMRDVSSQNMAALQPWLQAGTGALNTLTGRMPELTRRFTMSDFQEDPGYAFRLAEGQKALERSAAARGGLFSGGTGKALTRYGQDMGSQEYTNAYNRFMGGNQNEFNMLSGLAGTGQTATGQLINQNTQLGNVNAATEMAKANALTGGVNNFLNSQNRYSIYNDIMRPRGY